MAITTHLLSSSDKEKNRLNWFTHIKQWEESKLSQQAYCANAGIKLNTFTYWRSIFLSELSPGSQSKFVRVKVAAHQAASSEVPRSIQVKLVTGHVVYIPTNLEMREIAALIHLLGVPHAEG